MTIIELWVSKEDCPVCNPGKARASQPVRSRTAMTLGPYGRIENHQAAPTPGALRNPLFPPKTGERTLGGVPSDD